MTTLIFTPDSVTRKRRLKRQLLHAAACVLLCIFLLVKSRTESVPWHKAVFRNAEWTDKHKSVAHEASFNPLSCHALVWNSHTIHLYENISTQPKIDHSRKYAIVLSVTQLEMQYVPKVENSVRRIRQFSDHDIVIVILRDTAIPEAIDLLKNVSMSFRSIQVLIRDFGFQISSLSPTFIRFQEINSNCCGINEYIKLEIFNLPYDKVLALDVDVSLQKSPEVLFECDADFMYTAGPRTPLNAGVLVVRPSPQLYSSLIKTLQSVTMTYTQEYCFEGLGCGPCRPNLNDLNMCHGQEGPQGFLHYYFVKRRDKTLKVEKLSSCLFNYQFGDLCDGYWDAHGPPYIVHKGLSRLSSLLSMNKIIKYPLDKVCRADFWILGGLAGKTTELYTSMIEHTKLTGLNIHETVRAGEIFRPVAQLEYYNDAFSGVPNGSLAGDSTAHRLMTDAATIPKTCGHKYTRFIVLLRDPIERCHSQMLLNSRMGLNGLTEASNISEAVLDDLRSYRVIESALFNQTRDIYPQMDLNLGKNNCIMAGLYYLQLKRWFFHTSVRNFLIFFTEDFDIHTFDVVRAALNFVGVRAEDYNNFKVDIKKLTRNAAQTNLDLPLHQTLTPALRQELESVFFPYNALLETLIGRVPWTYGMHGDIAKDTQPIGD